MWEYLKDFDPRWTRAHRYALIDASWRDEMPTTWRPTVIAPAFLGADTSRCPVLLDLPQLPQDDCVALLDLVARQAKERADTLFSVLLASSVLTEALAGHLARRLVITMPGSDAPKQWRYFDPGTLLQLPQLLRPQGMAWLLGPVESVLVPWAGQWTRLVRPATEAGGFGLQAKHLEALSRIGVINRALLQRQPPADAATWMRACTALDDVVRRGIERHGLRRQGDLVAFAGQALDHHPHFDDHPRIQALLAAVRTAAAEDEIDYEEVSATLADTDWRAIVSELPAADPITASTKEGTA